MNRVRNRLRSWKNNSGTAPADSGRAPAPGRQRGFTLIEVLLAVVLLLLLLGALAFSFSSMRHGTELDEGVARFESLLRYSRAYAAGSGCKVRLVVASAPPSESGTDRPGIAVSWEADPMAHPGQWLKLSGPAWNLDGIHELVRVETVRPLNAADMIATEDAAPAADNLHMILFHPDGTSDSVEVVLVSRAPEDLRRIAVQLVGITGSIRHHRLQSADASEAPKAESESESAPEQPGKL